MKKVLSLVAIVVAFSSCKDTWPQEYKDQYHADCLAETKAGGTPEATAKTYCDCVLEKTIAKYPHVDDLMEHAMEVSSDPEIQKCKDLLK